MRIAQVAPLAESVPPKLYGGTERVVSWLTEELVQLGHDVTLFASADSHTNGSLVPVWPRALRLSRPPPDPYAPYSVLLSMLMDCVSSFDVIHCHIDWLHLPMLRHLEVPFLTTLHGRLDLGYVKTAMRSFPGAPFVSISENQRAPLPNVNWLATVYHGMPPDKLKPCYEPHGYLAFLGRMTPEKGPEVAIRLAKASGRPLRIAAKIPRGQNRYFKQRIEPMLDGDDIEFIGEVDDRSKGAFLGNAAALLFPIDWPEPFGLVMIEAMACGTPVIAMRRGSVPEIVEDGVTGFVVDSEEDALAAIGRLGSIDRRRVRAEFERRFTAGRMAQDYLRAYQSLSQQRRQLSVEYVQIGSAKDGLAPPMLTSSVHQKNGRAQHEDEAAKRAHPPRRPAPRSATQERAAIPRQRSGAPRGHEDTTSSSVALGGPEGIDPYVASETRDL